MKLCSSYVIVRLTLCAVVGSKKRLREEEEGADSLPLSKRITLLHLDSNNRFTLFSVFFLLTISRKLACIILVAFFFNI